MYILELCQVAYVWVVRFPIVCCHVRCVTYLVHLFALCIDNCHLYHLRHSYMLSMPCWVLGASALYMLYELLPCFCFIYLALNCCLYVHVHFHLSLQSPVSCSVTVALNCCLHVHDIILHYSQPHICLCGHARDHSCCCLGEYFTVFICLHLHCTLWALTLPLPNFSIAFM